MKKFLILFCTTFLHASFVNAQTLPLCVSSTTDSDGDGYGWENEQSCIVEVTVEAPVNEEQFCEDRGDFPWGWNPVTLSSCILGVQTEPSECVDSDGDGYGWNGLASCIVGSLQCEDRGGYPWGWNPTTLSSCRLDSPEQKPLPTECTDTDGDGVVALNAFAEIGDTSGRVVAIDGIIYFIGSSPETGSEVSVYDPVADELSIPGDVFSGPVSSLPSSLTVLDGKLYFTARDLITQRDFWVYDPATFEPPLPLRLFPDRRLEGATLPANLIAFDNKIFFTSDDFGIGNELTMYDPQTGEAGPVADIFEGEGSSDPKSLTVVQGKLYFSADDGINGRELWAYDPVDNTNIMVTDLSTSPNGSDPGSLYVIDDRIYYNTRSGGQTRIYDTQTEARPALLEYTVDGQQTSGEVIGAVSDLLVLRFNDESRGAEPWIYDPQSDTTTLIADINPGPEGSRATGFVELNGEIYFEAEASFGEFELWVYNANTKQTRRFIEPARSDLEFPANLTAIDNRLYFTAGPLGGPRDRRQWVYDSRCE